MTKSLRRFCADDVPILAVHDEVFATLIRFGLYRALAHAGVLFRGGLRFGRLVLPYDSRAGKHALARGSFLGVDIDVGGLGAPCAPHQLANSPSGGGKPAADVARELF